jgi:hypothetical protein
MKLVSEDYYHRGSQTTRKEWVDALNELNSSNVDETPKFNVNPATCM